ncbi:hypothetical protein LO772_00770 [Yinghuangia sp. ASG 101]|uniref:hypothetical protein n=1 Tax=Yinghuangia sp. ASG 101 TaxID=2896848 RepID=UPI001E3AEC32|nr:hypothetical protein [Yinghuangia sp. ASG 101]UGQ12177.1 hypothetical protein LO772_00770 [Yinghuangia sp. ASG 101]
MSTAPRLRLAVAAVASIAVAALVAAAIHALMEEFQYRPGHPDPARETVVHVTLDGRYGPPRAIDVEHLWGECATALTEAQLMAVPERPDARHLEVVVQPALTKHQKARVGGCLRDLTVHRIKTSEVSLTERTATTTPTGDPSPPP